MLNKRIFGNVLFVLALAAGLAAPGLCEAQSAANAEAARRDAGAAMEAWKKIALKTPGVQTSGNYVFSYAIHRFDPKKGGSSALAQARIAAESAAVRQLSDAVMKSAYAASGVAERLPQYYAQAVRLNFNGRVLLSECAENVCEAVFQTTTDEVEREQAKLDRKKLASEAKRDFKARPAAYGAFFADSGFPDAALAFEIRKTSPSLFNIPAPVVPTAVQSAAYGKFASARRAKVLSLLAAQPETNARDTSALALRAVIALDDEAEFRKSLAAAGIPSLQWTSELPLLAAVAKAQGFVKFDRSASASSPNAMGYIRELFAEGKNLALAVSLLEDAASRHPANPEVWEYLAAGYYAAGNKDAARICTRVWLCIAKDVSNPLIYLATHFDAGENGRVIAQLLK